MWVRLSETRAVDPAITDARDDESRASLELLPRVGRASMNR